MVHYDNDCTAKAPGELKKMHRYAVSSPIWTTFTDRIKVLTNRKKPTENATNEE
jgi:hypothetical protein